MNKNKPGPVVLEGRVIDVVARRIFPGRVVIEGGKIAEVRPHQTETSSYLLPGLIDAHVHVESSMLVPSEFARLAVIHGTVGTVSDPHEIGNVLGVRGVEFMLENSRQVRFKFCFGAPSCVPATDFETAGAVIDAAGVERLLSRSDIGYLSEVMNFPGVLHGVPHLMEKIAAAKAAGKPVDGHAPGLRGEDARLYIQAGISTDHECFTLEEALEKIEYGMKIIIREGSAARNYAALKSLIDTHPERVMLCSDDKHPNDLVEGHINQVIRRAIADGLSPMNAVAAATINPVQHYNLPVGLLQPGDPADLIVVEDLGSMRVLQTYIDGELAAENGRSLIDSVPVAAMNNFTSYETSARDFRIAQSGSGAVRAIEVFDGEIVTGSKRAEPLRSEGALCANTATDVLKLAVVNRYHRAAPACGFVVNVGLKRGAIASSVAHDSHNIIAVGTDDRELARAVNALMRAQGGVAAVCGEEEWVLPLPVAGLMSTEDGWTVGARYAEIDRKARELGSTLAAPYMTLSFLALLVIPELKLSDKGLFDGRKFEFVDLKV